MAPLHRSETVATFRARLLKLIGDSGLSQSRFAQRAGIDRSTLSQILTSPTQRLPRLETLIAIAQTTHVSLDWLVGLSEEGVLAAEVLQQSLQIEEGGRSPLDERLARWHAEAIGYKIRHVPTSLPDFLKTEALIEFEYELADLSPSSRMQKFQDDLAYHRRPESDVEVCSSLESVEALARGEGAWSELPLMARREQLEHMIGICDELYPSLRWFLFPALRRFSVPLTVFGIKRAAIYVGQRYLVFNSREHVRALTHHFDDLIRAASHQPLETIAALRALRDAL